MSTHSKKSLLQPFLYSFIPTIYSLPRIRVKSTFDSFVCFCYKHLMSRPLRIEYPGAWYHVMNRGRRAEEIFTERNDYCLFLDLLQESSELWNIKISAYCLMPNHYLCCYKPRRGTYHDACGTSMVYTPSALTVPTNAMASCFAAGLSPNTRLQIIKGQT